MAKNLKEKIDKFYKEISKKIDNNPENKEKYFNEVKEFIIKVGCELFNKTKKDYDDLILNKYGIFLYKSNLYNKDRVLAANYLALCNLLIVLKPKYINK